MKRTCFQISLCMLGMGLMLPIHASQASEPEPLPVDMIEPATATEEATRGVRLIEPIDTQPAADREAIMPIAPRSPSRQPQSASPGTQTAPRAIYQKVGVRRPAAEPQTARPSRLDLPSIIGRRRPEPAGPKASTREATAVIEVPLDRKVEPECMEQLPETSLLPTPPETPADDRSE